jgi:spermidine synthase
MHPPSPSVLVRADRPTGEWVLRRCTGPDGAGHYEIRLGGRQLMDSAEGPTEVALAELGLGRCAGRAGLRVLVGGLGFGFTLGAVLRDPRVAEAEVVELEPLLVEFLGRPAVRAELRTCDLADPRVRVQVGDVRERIAAAAGRLDCLLLDVDNGPGALATAGNGWLYGEEGLRAARRALRPGGVLAIWSAEAAPGCLARMRAVFGEAEALPIPVERGGHRFECWVLCAGGAGHAAATGR